MRDTAPAHTTPGPVAIGGVGGAGTRLGAALVRELGLYIGDDLNEALDNLWFTLLFKDPAILTASQAAFEQRCDLFWARMSGSRSLTAAERDLAKQLSKSQRFEHAPHWLAARARSLTAPRPAGAASAGWGWKEPNTSLVAGRLLSFEPGLSYIHFLRDPFVMAAGRNQNQLRNWGRALLGREAEEGPRAALSYWCEAHRRIREEMARWPGRCLMVDYDVLCAEPEAGCARIADFIGRPAPPGTIRRFSGLVARPEPAARLPASQFDPADLDYLAAAGYAV